MELLRAKTCEWKNIRDFYWDLIDRMQGRTDTVGWKKGIYPSDEFLRESLRKGELYIIPRGEEIAAAVILNSSWNPDYEGVLWGIDCPREKILVPHALGVHPLLQGQGIGKTVVGEILALAGQRKMQTVRLDILSGNTAAERLYTGAGFRFVQAKTMYYEDTGRTEFKLYERIL